MTHVIGFDIMEMFQEVSNQLSIDMMSRGANCDVELSEGCTLEKALRVYGLCVIAFPNLTPTFQDVIVITNEEEDYRTYTVYRISFSLVGL